jgi:hypothetical protein
MELRIETALRYQIVVRADLQNLPVIHHGDAICALDGRQSVGDHEHRSALHRAHQRLLYQALGLVV